MKKLHLYIAGAALLTLAGACSEEQFNVTGEGKVQLSATLSSDMEVVSRATDQELADGCRIWISGEKGLVRKYQGIGEIPADGIDLVTGHYVAEAWAGDSVSASFDTRAFYGREEFDVAAGQSTPVNLTCKIANVAASVNYAEGIEEVLTDFTMTIGHDRGSLIFEGRDERRGYFMMPSTSTGLTYELKGTQIDGSEFRTTGVIPDVKKATEYKLMVKYTPVTTSVGGAVFSIIVDEKEIEVQTEIEIISAPKITGYGFDIANPVVGEPGVVGEKSVYVASAAEVTKLEIRSDWFSNYPVLGGTGIDMLNMNETGVNTMTEAGLTCKKTYDAETGTLIKINFAEELTNKLEAGEYNFEITAIDDAGRTATATLRLNVSSAPVLTLPNTVVAAHSATLRGQITKDGVTEAGFSYRVKGTADWTYVAAEAPFTPGTEYTVALTGLKGNTTYEYASATPDYTSALVESFTTDNDQLPNSSFEEWTTYDNAGIPGSAYPAFWDTGNHGSKTMMGRQVTTQSTDYAHSGSYSICLKSQFVGVGRLGKFAAGNVFAGRYLYTDNTDGELGWGQPWTLKPRQVKAWVKYVPGTVNDKGAGDKLAQGAQDQGIIYVALMDAHTNHYDRDNSDWPAIIKTRTAELFDPAGEHVVAYGEHLFTSATEGNGLVEITIDLKDVHGDLDVANIIFVGSASRYGDYFQGGEGSLLYIDDIQLVY